MLYDKVITFDVTDPPELAAWVLPRRLPLIIGGSRNR